ncbi:MAG: hypothetical protein IJ583_05860 [Firmicutes bacterium]|nr:hypothetical protein [Bacillota bacterium]
MKKTINKWVCVLTVTVLMLCSMSGCGKDNKDVEIETNNDVEETSINTDNKENKENTDAVSYSVGDIVTFGTFEQDDNESNGAEPIEWIVLDADGSKALLLSKYVLAEEQYNIQDKQVTWQTSTLFQWLNADFLNGAFSEEERQQIINTEYGKVFLLSFDEAVKYFDMSPVDEHDTISDMDYVCYYSEKALAEPTKFASSGYTGAKEFKQDYYDKLTEKGVTYNSDVIGNTYAPYWLRTLVEGDGSCVNAVNEQGGLRDKTISNSAYLLAKSDIGVRPAIWIGEESNIEQTETSEERTESKANLGNSTQGISRFYGYDLPLMFSLDYEYADDDTLIYNIEDKGGYYLVSGSIVCPECVNENNVYNSTFETGSGHKYTVTGTESYNNDQREKLMLAGEDGQTYTIFNIPAFMLDTYTGEQYYPISNENNEYFKTIFENVVLQIDKDTVFYDGNVAGDTFETAVNNGTFENATYSIAYDIHFAEDGSIDILTPSDIGSNGVMGWYDASTVIWHDTLD